MEAFQRYDIDSLVALLHEEVVMSMPPYDFWLRGPANMGRWFLGQGSGCRGSRLVATAANGCAAFGAYKIDPAGGYLPFAIQVIEMSGDRITGHHNFVDARRCSRRSGCPPALIPRPRGCELSDQRTVPR